MKFILNLSIFALIFLFTYGALCLINPGWILQLGWKAAAAFYSIIIGVPIAIVVYVLIMDRKAKGARRR